MLGLLFSALISVAAHRGTVPDQHLGPWTVRQEEAGSALRVLFVSAPSETRNGPDLLLTCDGNFFIDVLGSAPVYAGDDEATLILPGNVERKAPAMLMQGKMLHISATALMGEILTANRLGVKLHDRAGLERDVFFALPDLRAGKPLLEKFCAVPAGTL